jgi:DNA-directed RNA polymerase subunit M/transcription elongation factor TFIIS
MITKALKNISRKKNNVELFRKYLSEEKKDDSLDKIYELSLMLKDGHNLQKVFSELKSNKLGLNHDDFKTISKKIDEMDTFMDKPFDITEGVNKCYKCGSMRTMAYSKQTRSSDEATTIFIFCVDCKNRYIHSD